jgi:hypothetical protein
MGTIQNPEFISTDETTSHSTKLPNNGSQVAGYAALRKKFSYGQPEGCPALKLRFLACISSICGAAKNFSRFAFERILNF